MDPSEPVAVAWIVYDKNGPYRGALYGGPFHSKEGADEACSYLNDRPIGHTLWYSRPYHVVPLCPPAALATAEARGMEEAAKIVEGRAARFKKGADDPTLPPIIAIVPQTRSIEAYDCAAAIRRASASASEGAVGA